MRKELISRVAGALVFVFVLLVFVYVLERLWFNALILLILTITYYEWCALCGVRGRLGRVALSLAFAALAAAASYSLFDLGQVSPDLHRLFIRLSSGSLSLLWLGATVALIYLVRVKAVIRRPYLRESGYAVRVPMLVLGVVALLPCLWLIDYIYSRGEQGRLLLMFFLGICVMMDVMAFFSGKTLGRHRLCPNISPNKTVQGLAGGAIASMAWIVVGWLIFLDSWLPGQFTVFMFAVVVAAVAGDLLESLLKRMAQIKDSCTIVYGHGGMYDRIDSIIAAAPVFVFVLSFYI